MDSGLKPPGRPERPNPPQGRGNVLALAAIAALAVALYFVVSAIQKHNAIQNCMDSGRHDCVALPAD